MNSNDKNELVSCALELWNELAEAAAGQPLVRLTRADIETWPCASLAIARACFSVGLIAGTLARVSSRARVRELEARIAELEAEVARLSPALD